ncbi:MAG: hypothetical protein U9O94_06810 [Nanoarchaeota archaeon]|nr:hypothetical protein [Nanoarchaeota archaeon]
MKIKGKNKEIAISAILFGFIVMMFASSFSYLGVEGQEQLSPPGAFASFLDWLTSNAVLFGSLVVMVILTVTIVFVVKYVNRRKK